MLAAAMMLLCVTAHACVCAVGTQMPSAQVRAQTETCHINPPEGARARVNQGELPLQAKETTWRLTHAGRAGS